MEKGADISTVSRSPGESEAPGLRRQDFLRRAAVTGVAVSGAGGLIAAQAEGRRRALKRLDDLGLRYVASRFDRVIANVTDLERAKEFWEKFTTLRAYARTTSPKQAFHNLGISRGQFDGYLLQDPWGGNPCSVHLVQWHTPKPVGIPYKSPLHIGWYRACFATPNARKWYNKLVAAGERPWSEPRPFSIVAGDPGTPVFGFPDPDGLTIEFHQPAGTQLTQLDHVATSTAHLDRNRPFYTDVLGLDLYARSRFCPVPNTLGPDGGEAGFEFCFYRSRGDARFYIDHLTWPPPAAAFGTPYDIFRQPTHVGFVRLSLEVDDIDLAYAILRRAGLKKKPKRGLGLRLSGPPEEWDFGPEFGGRRKVVIFTDPEGVGFELIQRQPFNRALNKPQPLLGACLPPGSVALPPQPDRM